MAEVKATVVKELLRPLLKEVNTRTKVTTKVALTLSHNNRLNLAKAKWVSLFNVL